VVRCRTCDREVAGSNPTRGCCVPTPTQRAIPPGSVNEYQRKPGLNGYTTRCTSAISMVLRLRLVSGWELWNGDHRRPMGLRLGKGLYFYHSSTFKCISVNEADFEICHFANFRPPWPWPWIGSYGILLCITLSTYHISLNFEQMYVGMHNKTGFRSTQRPPNSFAHFHSSAIPGYQGFQPFVITYIYNIVNNI